MRYAVAIEPATKGTCYGVAVPDLPGCFSAGDTLEEALAGAEESAAAWIDATLAAGDPVPPKPRDDLRRGQAGTQSDADEAAARFRAGQGSMPSGAVERVCPDGR